MKVLYISHSREQSGYGRYCRDFLKALKTTDLDISSIAIPLGKATALKDETEDKCISNPDLIIQNILPHLMSKGNIRTIGTAILESEDVKYNYWHQHLQMLDEVIYPHHPLELFNKEISIPTGIDLDKTKNIPKMNIEEINGTYKFYWIGELSKRKNLSGLIKSYFEAFSYSDPVSLVIKAHSSNFDEITTKRQIDETIYTIANGMKLYGNVKNYPRIVVLTNFFTNEQILGLHDYCDCFLSSSHGESICYPMLDAMLFNKPVVSTSTFATEYYMQYGNIELVTSDNKESCFGMVDTFDFYQTSLESWASFNLNLFSEKMRKVYENRKTVNNDLSDLSYVKIGEKIKEAIS